MLRMIRGPDATRVSLNRFVIRRPQQVHQRMVELDYCDAALLLMLARYTGRDEVGEQQDVFVR